MEKANVNAAEDKLRNLQTKLENMHYISKVSSTSFCRVLGVLRLWQEIAQTVHLIQETKEVLTKYEGSLAKVRNDQEEIRQKEMTMRDTEHEELQLQAQVGLQSEKLVRLQRQYTARKESHEKKLAQLKEEFETVQADKSEKEAKIEEFGRLGQQIEQKVAHIVVEASPICWWHYRWMRPNEHMNKICN